MKNKKLFNPNNLIFEPPEGFEPTTPRLQITCSGQLSYGGNCLIASANIDKNFNPAKKYFIFFTIIF